MDDNGHRQRWTTTAIDGGSRDGLFAVAVEDDNSMVAVAGGDDLPRCRLRRPMAAAAMVVFVHGGHHRRRRRWDHGSDGGVLGVENGANGGRYHRGSSVNRV